MNPESRFPADVAIRPMRPEDAEAALGCHNAVFATGGPLRSLAHWRWRFEQNPSGRMHTLVATHGGGVAAVYGAIPIRVSALGHRELATQIVDVAVRPEFLRAGLAQSPGGLFARMAHAFVDRWIGSGADQAMFAYGLPVQAWRSSSQHVGWQCTRDWNVLLRFLPAGASPRMVPSDLEVLSVDVFDDAADDLFRQIEAEGGLLTVRDRLYLNWRYARHPDRRYRLFCCRERQTAKLRGICIYGRGDLLRQNTSYLLDWLVPLADHDTTAALLGAAERQAQGDGTGLLCGVWSPSDPRFVRLQELGYSVRGTPWFLTTYSAGYDMLFFREQWRFCLGDSDLL